MENVERMVQMCGADATAKWARMCCGEEVLCERCKCVVQMQRQSGRGCAVAKKFCARSANAWCRCMVQMQQRSRRGCAVAKKFCAHSADVWCRCSGEVCKNAARLV